MTDEEAADFYADPANRAFNPDRVVRRPPLGDSIPVRFPNRILEQVRAAAAADGVTVSEWVRQAVADSLAQRNAPEDSATIAQELERLARRLRHSA